MLEVAGDLRRALAKFENPDYSILFLFTFSFPRIHDEMNKCWL